MNQQGKNQLSIQLKCANETLIKKKEEWEWHNKQAMGTEGGEGLLHEEVISELSNAIKDLEQHIKELERKLINKN